MLFSDCSDPKWGRMGFNTEYQHLEVGGPHHVAIVWKIWSGIARALVLFMFKSFSLVYCVFKFECVIFFYFIFLFLKSSYIAQKYSIKTVNFLEIFSYPLNGFRGIYRLISTNFNFVKCVCTSFIDLWLLYIRIGFAPHCLVPSV